MKRLHHAHNRVSENVIRAHQKAWGVLSTRVCYRQGSVESYDPVRRHLGIRMNNLIDTTFFRVFDRICDRVHEVTT